MGKVTVFPSKNPRKEVLERQIELAEQQYGAVQTQCTAL